MTKIQELIKEINNLSLKDLEVILQQILRRVDRKKRAEAALENLIGSGKGVWDTDGQRYVDELREGDGKKIAISF